MRRSGSPSKRSLHKISWLGHFEPLEARTMLAGTAVIEDGALLIQGDAEANTIDVAIAGDTVNVTVDGTAMEPFTGLGTEFSAIKVDGKAGDDTITVNASDVTIQPDQEVRLAVNGADGNDTITVNTQNVKVATQATPSDGTTTDNTTTSVTNEEESDTVEEGGTLKLDVRGGVGDDTIAVAIDGVTVDEGARWGVAIDGGMGDDLVSVLAENATVAGHASLDVRLGWGNDQLDATLNNLTVGETGMLSQTLDGGWGNDTANLQASSVAIDGLAKAWARGGMGDDTLNVSTTDVTVHGKLDTQIRGGFGDDSLTVAGSGITVNGTVRGKVDGGFGEDTLTDERAADAVTLGTDAVVDVKVTEGPQKSLRHGEEAPKMDDLSSKLEGKFQDLRRRLVGLLGRDA